MGPGHFHVIHGFAYLAHTIRADSCAINLDFIGVHGRVGNENLRVFDPLWLAHTNFLIEDEALLALQ